MQAICVIGFIHFNPRTPCGVRLKRGGFVGLLCLFQSTHPVWGATHLGKSKTRTAENFNPRTPCGVRQCAGFVVGCSQLKFQSTHPVWGATFTRVHQSGWPAIFQSTHPVWGATDVQNAFQGFAKQFQSTHPVWGATRPLTPWLLHPQPISIHAPRVGCDQGLVDSIPTIVQFQSTHPVWGATST